MKFGILFIISFMLTMAGTLFCQGNLPEYQRKIFTTEHGLPHNAIYSITRDTTGFLWLATWDGLSRFDGNEFRNYRHDPDDPGSLPFFIPSKVLTDRLNNVWVHTNSRPVFVYNRADDNFVPGLEGLYRDAKAGDLTCDTSGNIWIALDTVLLRYDHETREPVPVRIIRDGSLISGPQYQSPHIAFDNKGNLWYLLSDGANFRAYKGSVSGDTISLNYAGLLSLQGFASLPLRTSNMYVEVNVSESGTSWLSCRHGLFRCDTVTKKFIYESRIDPGQLPGENLFCWIDEHSGINVRNHEKNSFTNLPVGEGEYVECVFTDRSGTIWSASIGNTRDNSGLNRYTPVPPWFTHYPDSRQDKESPDIVFPIVRDKMGDLWIGTRNQTLIYRIKADGSETRFLLPQDRPGDKGPQVRCMAEDEGGVWFGTTDGRLFKFRFESRDVRQIYPVPGSDKPVISGLHNILTDGNSLVINGSEGVYRFDIIAQEPELCYSHLPPGTGFSLVKDDRDGFWLGSWGSLVIHLDSALQKTGEFILGDGENIAEHICIGDSSDVWVALMGGGLGHLYPETGKTEILTTADGLPNNITYSILRDNRGSLWISTNDGLSMFNPETRVFRNYGKAQGIMISEFNSDSFFRTPSGEMFFGGIGGVVGFFPDSIADNLRLSDKKNLAITWLKVSGSSYNMKKAPYETDTFILRKGFNNFQARMTLFDLVTPEKVLYRYRLSGRDNDWIVTDNRNPVISYSNLTHRDYHLELEATDDLGEWAFRKTVLITVPHRFLEHPVVRAVLLILFLVPLLFAVISYLRNQRLKDRQLLDRLRLESLRSQMNPHFMFNSLSSINYFIAKEDRLAANEYIADFSRLIRSIIDNMGEDYITVERELRSLNDYLKLEHLRFGDRFTYTLSAEKIESPHDVTVFPGMIQPFVENAIWHGVGNLTERKGHLSIVLDYAGPERLRCTVEDDGVGRKKALAIRGKLSGHRSRGIELVTERLKIYNAMNRRDYKIIMEDLYPEREETGTRVNIDLPAGRINLH